MATTCATYPIKGISTGIGPALGQVPVRQEIDRWYLNEENKEQVHLFLLALDRFQKMDINDKLSYFQVAGIHGSPLVPWDEDLKPQKDNDGYCTHNSTLFITWHRPFTLLFEQRIYEIMQEIVQEYPENERARYKAAADTWRLPYWDWAELKHRDPAKPPIYDIPLLVQPATIEVHGPCGPVKLDPNPLAKFTVPGGKAFGDLGRYKVNGFKDKDGFCYPYNITHSTSRYLPQYDPNNEHVVQQWREGVIDNKAVVDALNRNAEAPEPNLTLRSYVYRALHNDTFDSFATTLINENGKPVLGNEMSLEGVHNVVHDYTGGVGGNMAWNLVSAFDPIFFLHHSNMERLFTIWQTLYPYAWFTDPREQLKDPGCYFIKPYDTPTPQTSLHPFHRDDKGTLHTSDSIRDWFQFNYTYPELQPWLDKYKAEDKKFDLSLYYTDVVAQIKAQYGLDPGRFLDLRPPTAAAEGDGQIMQHEDYIVDITYNRTGLNGGDPYRIYVFLGPATEIDKDPKKWLSSKNLVGTLYTFSNPSPLPSEGEEGGRCGNCERQRDANILSRGQIPLIDKLITHIADEQTSLTDLKRPMVREYLKKYISWAVASISGVAVPEEELPSLQLEVKVLAGLATHYLETDRLSKFENYDIEHSITEGRAGGYSLPSA
ncbi:hypothetical protein BDZ91DRAFT_749645 [Kalaharituber pfeilii]|nr:hypothetical protein BDZ91DRAFT_749645 [Kalaharituber pfeilii]